MDSPPLLVVKVCEPAASLPLSIARAQAYAAAGALVGWRLLPDVAEPSDAAQMAERAVVLIGADSSQILQWINAKWAVIADGIWSEDPAQITQVVDLSRRVAVPFLQGDELLHAPVLAGAITEASEIGPITSGEIRGVHPRDAVSDQELLGLHAPSLLMRALLCLNLLWPAPASTSTDWTLRKSGMAMSEGTRVEVRGSVPAIGGAPSAKIDVSISTHRGRSVIQDLQFSSTTGVVRAEVMPIPALEVNGSPVTLPEAAHSPAQLEMFGMIPMLQLMRRAVHERTQPLTSPSLLATALQILRA
jgi:hypothetical protein